MMTNNNRKEQDLILNCFFDPDEIWFVVSVLQIALWEELGGRKILCGTLAARKSSSPSVV